MCVASFPQRSYLQLLLKFHLRTICFDLDADCFSGQYIEIIIFKEIINAVYRQHDSPGEAVGLHPASSTRCTDEDGTYYVCFNYTEAPVDVQIPWERIRIVVPEKHGGRRLLKA
jgi:hypothetical protein